ncbi:MAG: (Fe-S)-binding protein [Nitrospirota bacterium]
MKNFNYLEDLSKCVRCGSCKAFCPTYDEDITEAMGARGRLALLWSLSSGQLTSSPLLNDYIFSCTLCGACTGLCPTGIDIKEIIYHGRGILRKTDKKRRYLRFLTNFFIKSPKLSFKFLSMTQGILFPYLQKTGIIPFKLELPEQYLKNGQQVYQVHKKKGRIAIFTGCAVNFLYPHLGASLINVLRSLDYEVILPTGEVCCGMPLRTLGMEKEAIKLAKKNVSIFNKLNVEAVLSLCPTCTLAIKGDYPKLIGEGIEKAMDISSFFVDKLNPSQLSHLPSDFKKAVYHDPCHLKYGLGIEKEPREIIGHTGIDLIETRGQKCCGFAGVFSIAYKELSQGILNKCLGDYVKAGGEMIITSCPGCMIQLSRGSEDKPVLHLIEIIEEALLPEHG